MSSIEDQPTRMLVLAAPACEPEHLAPEQRFRVDRLWNEAFDAVQRTVPGAVQLRQGYCAMRARGPTRYYGSETEAARAVLGCVAELLRDELGEGLAVGVASSRFTAEQAALAATRKQAGTPDLLLPAPGVYLVPAEQTAAFLSELPIACAADEQLAPVLVSLGIRTLGAFAALPKTRCCSASGAPHSSRTAGLAASVNHTVQRSGQAFPATTSP